MHKSLAIALVAASSSITASAIFDIVGGVFGVSFTVIDTVEDVVVAPSLSVALAVSE